MSKRVKLVLPVSIQVSFYSFTAHGDPGISDIKNSLKQRKICYYF